MARLRAGRTGLGIFDAKDGPRPGVPHHTFEFEGPRDPDVMVRELEAKGPCGNRIELSTDPA